jgi:hypothetical protein
MTGILGSREAMQKIQEDLAVTLEHLDRQIDEVYHYAGSQDIPVQSIRHTDGSWVLAPLLIAKAQVLCTLVDLQRGFSSPVFNQYVAPGPYPPLPDHH